VIVNGRSEAKVAEAVKRLGAKTGAEASGIAADLGDADGATRLAERPHRHPRQQRWHFRAGAIPRHH
jgi:hypothetical protein